DVVEEERAGLATEHAAAVLDDGAFEELETLVDLADAAVELGGTVEVFRRLGQAREGLGVALEGGERRGSRGFEARALVAERVRALDADERCVTADVVGLLGDVLVKERNGRRTILPLRGEDGLPEEEAVPARIGLLGERELLAGRFVLGLVVVLGV